MHQLSTLTPKAGRNSNFVWHTWVTAGIGLCCLQMSCGVFVHKKIAWV